MNFANNLKTIRKSKHMPQRELAAIANVSQRAISHYEDKTAQPSLETLCLIADYLQVSLEELVR